MIRHAGLIARFQSGGWRGVLIEGESGSGKSDLALRALDQGWTLIADDRTLLWAAEDRLYGRAPDAIAGMIEARGLGVLRQASRHLARIVLVVRCMESAAIARLPETAAETVLGVRLPVVALTALEPSAPAKLGRALSVLDLPANRRIKRPASGAFSPDAGGVP
jgi:serine kinase of HPr protein (carbohydrate metabolism regulator)